MCSRQHPSSSPTLEPPSSPRLSQESRTLIPRFRFCYLEKLRSPPISPLSPFILSSGPPPPLLPTFFACTLSFVVIFDLDDLIFCICNSKLFLFLRKSKLIRERSRAFLSWPTSPFCGNEISTSWRYFIVFIYKSIPSYSILSFDFFPRSIFQFSQSKFIANENYCQRWAISVLSFSKVWTKTQRHLLDICTKFRFVADISSAAFLNITRGIFVTEGLLPAAVAIWSITFHSSIKFRGAFCVPMVFYRPLEHDAPLSANLGNDVTVNVFVRRVQKSDFFLVDSF